ncbi:MAG: MarR family transcriptional regulator [Corynebacterium sp.]|nr:MarR family transcriptional regulator [Corynebacterium sp.]
MRSAIESGSQTVKEIAQSTGLTTSTVTAALEHLERIGYLQRRREAMACGGGCSSCSDDQCGTTGGLVTLTLSRVPPANHATIAGND